MNIAAMLRPRILQELRKLNLTFPSAHCITTRPKSCVRRFSRCHVTALSCCPQYYKSPTLTRSEHCRTIRTSSLSRKLSSLNDAFSETNKTRLVKQLGMMKPRKSLLATCSEEAAVFVPFCLVDSVPSVLFTLRSSQLNSHRGEVRSVPVLVLCTSQIEASTSPPPPGIPRAIDWAGGNLNVALKGWGI